MSRRLMKVCIAMALVVSALVGASSASANWTTNGPGSFVGTAGGSLLTITTTSGTARGISCTTSTGAGSLNGPTVSGNTLGALTPAFSGCTVVGQAAKVSCGSATLTGTSYSAPTTTGSLTGVSCLIALNSGACGNTTTLASGIKVTGSVTGTYGNTSKTLTILTTGQSLTAAANNAGCGVGTPASSKFTNAAGTGPLGYLSIASGSAIIPNITNP